MTKAVIPYDSKAEIIARALPFDESILAGQIRPSSQKMYRRDFLAYLSFAGTPERALNSVTLAEWVQWLVEHTQYSPKTINRMISAVKRLMKEAAKREYTSHENYERFRHIDGVKESALVERKKRTARTRISKEDMRRLCDTPNLDTLKGVRDKALLYTLASSGVRASEAASLTKQQIGQEDGKYFIEVLGKNQKEPRRAHLNSEAYKAIMRWLDMRGVESDYLFLSFARKGNDLQERHMTTDAIWQTVQAYAEACGLEHVKPHDFRRFVGTQLTKDKGIRHAQIALGHKSLNTTQEYDLSQLELGATEGLF